MKKLSLDQKHFWDRFLGDGLTRFGREPMIHNKWKAYQSNVDPRVQVIGVDLSGFIPCVNGEHIPDLLPC